MKKTQKKTVFIVVIVVLVVISVVACFLVHYLNGVWINSRNFPDPVFRERIKEYDKNKDGKLSKKEIEVVTQIDVSDANIKTLEGIECFVDLEYLTCKNNRLKSLDLSKNEVIIFVDCSDNLIHELLLPDTKSLKTLYCRNNYLDSLKVNIYPELESLDCAENRLRTLELSKNKRLDRLYCDDNNLSNLDISKNPQLEKLGCSNNKLGQLDLTHNQSLTYLSCSDNRLTSLNVSRNKELRSLWCDRNNISMLNIENCVYLRMWYLIGDKIDLPDSTLISYGINFFSYDKKTKLVGVD